MFHSTNNHIFVEIVNNIAYEFFRYNQTQATLPYIKKQSSIVTTVSKEMSASLKKMNDKKFNKEIQSHFSNFFGIDVKKREKNDSEKDMDLEKNFAPCLGALKIIKDGWETEAIPKMSDRNIEKIGFFAKFFGIH